MQCLQEVLAQVGHLLSLFMAQIKPILQNTHEFGSMLVLHRETLPCIEGYPDTLRMLHETFDCVEHKIAHVCFGHELKFALIHFMMHYICALPEGQVSKVLSNSLHNRLI